MNQFLRSKSTLAGLSTAVVGVTMYWYIGVSAGVAPTPQTPIVRPSRPEAPQASRGRTNRSVRPTRSDSRINRPVHYPRDVRLNKRNPRHPGRTHPTKTKKMAPGS